MGWLFRDIDEELLNSCLQGRLLDAARTINYCHHKLNDEELSNVERLVIEINKRKATEKAAAILEQLGKEEFIQVEDEIICKEYHSSLEIYLYSVR